MLVLSRKKNQSILFPNLGIEVVVQRIVGNSVSVGIIAPKSVQILRSELAEGAVNNVNALQSNRVEGATTAEASPASRELLHTLRNQLNKAQLAVSLAQKKLQLGREGDAEQILSEMLEQLRAIDHQADAVSSKPTSPSSTMVGRTSERMGRGENLVKRPKHAMVVEDDANERALLAGYLRLCGFTVSEASDGVEAIEFLEGCHVDLVILDMRMPRMNGIETAKAIRSRPSLRDIKILVVSGEDRREIAKDDEPEVAEWFAKPLNPDRLASYFESMMN